jgi:hypothetical protein
MRGYHYTDARNLPSIMERGVVPYPLREERHPGVHEIVGRTTGIFVYLRPQTGRDHFGMAAANGLRHGTSHVVVLEVEFSDADTAQTDAPLVHDGHIDGIVYHVAEPFVIVAETITPNRIQLFDHVPTAAALGWLYGASGVLAEWQAERIARGLGSGPRPPLKINRNGLCVCGSGRKAKRCCAS